MKKIGFILALICPFILFGCKHKTQENTEENNYDYPITIISDTLKTDVSDQTELFPLSEDFMESFLEKHDDFQGYKITAKIPFPEEWGLQCVERLPERIVAVTVTVARVDVPGHHLRIRYTAHFGSDARGTESRQ